MSKRSSVGVLEKIARNPLYADYYCMDLNTADLSAGHPSKYHVFFFQMMFMFMHTMISNGLKTVYLAAINKTKISPGQHAPALHVYNIWLCPWSLQNSGISLNSINSPATVAAHAWVKHCSLQRSRNCADPSDHSFLLHFQRDMLGINGRPDLTPYMTWQFFSFSLLQKKASACM